MLKSKDVSSLTVLILPKIIYLPLVIRGWSDTHVLTSSSGNKYGDIVDILDIKLL